MLCLHWIKLFASNKNIVSALEFAYIALTIIQHKRVHTYGVLNSLRSTKTREMMFELFIIRRDEFSVSNMFEVHTSAIMFRDPFIFTLFRPVKEES